MNYCIARESCHQLEVVNYLAGREIKFANDFANMTDNE
jgi:hypothetical protein